MHYPERQNLMFLLHAYVKFTFFALNNINQNLIISEISFCRRRTLNAKNIFFLSTNFMLSPSWCILFTEKWWAEKMLTFSVKMRTWAFSAKTTSWRTSHPPWRRWPVTRPPQTGWRRLYSTICLLLSGFLSSLTIEYIGNAMSKFN